MNIGYMAARAAPKLFRALRRNGLWFMTKQDLLDVLKAHPQGVSRSTDAIFWFCQAWHDGDDDLYKIMAALPESYVPRPWSPLPTKKDPRTGTEVVNPNYDPVLTELIELLERSFIKTIVTPELRPVKLADVREGHVLTAGSHFLHIPNRWPCRVYRQHGALGVFCSAEAASHGVIRLTPDSKVGFQPLTEDAQGFVVGFRR